MDRPSTSKPRGICRYWDSPRGCFAGKKCKFLHGDAQKLTPYDKNKVCTFYEAGYCRRGADCWFRHPGGASVDDDLNCSVCYEKPVTYALLTGCSHVFCIQCIRQWRASSKKDSDVVTTETAKSCPYCRTSSRFVTPSSQFFPENHPRKAEIIARYRASMARVPCKHFQKSPSDQRHCPFGRECFYQHQNDDGSPYLFTGGIEENMNTLEWPPLRNLDDINATLAALRRNLPSLLGMEGPVDTERILNLAEGMLQDLSLIQNMYDNEGGHNHEDNDQPEPADNEPVELPITTIPPPFIEFERQRSLTLAAEFARLPITPIRSPEPEMPVLESVPPEEDEEDDVDNEATPIASTSTSTTFDESESPTPVYHNPNPPFATDGRGRVVWSNSNRGQIKPRSDEPEAESVVSAGGSYSENHDVSLSPTVTLPRTPPPATGSYWRSFFGRVFETILGG